MKVTRRQGSVVRRAAAAALGCLVLGRNGVARLAGNRAVGLCRVAVELESWLLAQYLYKIKMETFVESV